MANIIPVRTFGVPGPAGPEGPAGAAGANAVVNISGAGNFVAQKDGVNQSVTSNTLTKVDFPYIESLAGDIYESFSSAFKPSGTGAYLVSANLAYNATREINDLDIYLYRNGIATGEIAVHERASSLSPTFGPTTVSINKILTVPQTGDYYEVYTKQSSEHQVKAHGGIEISPNERHSESGAAYFPQETDSFISIPWSPEFDWSTGNFTIEGWVKQSSTSAGQAVMSHSKGGAKYNSSWVLWLGANGVGAGLYVTTGGGSWDTSADGTVVLGGGWKHFAGQRSGDKLSFYWDGTRVQETTLSNDYSVYNSTRDLELGTQDGANPLHGYLDDVRISNKARYAGTTITPSAAQQTSDDNTILLLDWGSGRHEDHSRPPIEISGAKSETNFSAVAMGGLKGDKGDVGSAGGTVTIIAPAETGNAFTPDCSVTGIFDYEVSGTTMINAPVGLVNGNSFLMTLRQYSSPFPNGGNLVAFDAEYKFDQAYSAVTTSSGAIDMVSITNVNGTYMASMLNEFA